MKQENYSVKSPKLVDLVIPIHNRLELTKQTLQSLQDHTNPDLYNLYLVDDMSTDGTREYLDVHKKLIPIFFNEENIGPGASRNMVAKWITDKNLRSTYLYESDNDVYFTDRWLEDLLQAFLMAETKDIILLGASCHPYLQNKEVIDLEDGRYKVGIKDAVSGYSQLMRWSTWDKYGLFDETMRGAEKKIMGSEDWAFCQKIISDGHKVGSLEPEVVIPCGKTNTYGEVATGAETFKDYEGVKVI